MKMRLCIIGTLAVFVAFLVGCNGDGGSTDSTPPPPPAPGPGPGGGGPSVIDSGTEIAPAAGTMGPVTFSVPGPGTLSATVSWGAPPPSMLVYFRHGGPGSIGVVTGSSPLTTATTVAGAGSGWELYVVNMPGPPVNVTYSITFTPD